MKKLEYQVRFNTPAFLGNAEQKGQWRTPPFKALLRQWWRVVYAEANGFPSDTKAMRHIEGKLFGNAWLKDDFQKSEVRIRLNRWDSPKNDAWQPLDKVNHPEVNFQVGSDLYLGFGPITYDKNTHHVKANAHIQAKEQAVLSLAAPDAAIEQIEQAIALLDRYGTLGGRSRNGWGSASFVPQGNTAALPDYRVTRPWQEALQLDWPHAIGLDDRGSPLIWQTEPFGDWKHLMRQLAIIKIGLRTQFLFHSGNGAWQPESRHWLSHPVTKHNVQPWRNGRLPNSLRLKVRPDPADASKLRGIIFHVPVRPPNQFAPDLEAVNNTWQQVHQLLDELGKPGGDRSYSMISDQNRRDALSNQLRGVTIKRASS